MPKVSVKGVARSAVAAEKREVKARDKARDKSKTQDSFQNLAAGLGIGVSTQLSSSTYGFNPISRERTLLEWIHRGSWLGGMAIDIIADDMTKMGVDVLGDLDPDDVHHLERAATSYGIWAAINDNVKWSRLYGGSIAVMLIDGQKMDTPLIIERVGKQQFRGLQVLDRWMVDSSLNDLVTDFGPDLGLPKFYTVLSDAPALRRMKIHYSRVMRLEGIRLPYWQRVMENLWGVSVIERMYDRMVAFDSATTGAAQLSFKSFIRTYGIKGFREAVAAGGKALEGLLKMVEMMRRFQGAEGITLLDAEDVFQAQANGAFSGMAEIILQMGQQVSGSLQIPLVRLFGQSPAGLNSTGESDLRMYYDGINQKQESPHFKNPVTRIYQVMAQSEGVKLGEGFSLKFKPLWQLTDAEKSTIAATDTATVREGFESGIIDNRETALEELKQSSRVTGRWTNISDEEMKEAAEEPPPMIKGALETAAAMEITGENEEDEPSGGDNKEDKKKDKKKKKAKDAMLGDRTVLGFPLVIEHERGTERYSLTLPCDYGYIRQTDSAERGDQMDAMIGPDANSQKIFIVDSYRFNGSFDEHKVMFGYLTSGEAILSFRSYYYERNGYVTEVTREALMEWLKTGDVSRPYTQPVDTQYKAATDPDKGCGKCMFFREPFCMNEKVQRDPVVPQVGETKLVSLAMGCNQFTHKS